MQCLALAHSQGLRVSFVDSARLPEPEITNLEFVDAESGWLRTIANLWRTRDAGQHWTSLPVTSSDSGLTISYKFRTPQNGWLLSVSGILLSHDGGDSWSRLPVPESFQSGRGELQCAWFSSDLRIAWVGGGIYERSPGGTLHGPGNAIDIGPDGAVRVLRPAVFRTVNGGRTWDRQIVISDEYRVKQLVFLDSQHGCLRTEKSTFWTTSGGKVWARSAFPRLGTNNDWRFDLDSISAAMIFLNADHGWLVFQNGDIFRTVDGARSWNLAAQGVGSNDGPAEELQFISTDAGFLRTAQGALFFTNDGGGSWHPVNVGGHVWAISGAVNAHSILAAVGDRLRSLEVR